MIIAESLLRMGYISARIAWEPPAATPSTTGLQSVSDKFMSPLYPVVSVVKEVLFASGDVEIIPAPPAGYVHVYRSGLSMWLNVNTTALQSAVWKTAGITIQDTTASAGSVAGCATNTTLLPNGQMFTAAVTCALSGADGTKGIIALDYEVQPASLWTGALLNLTTSFQTVPLTIPPGYATTFCPTVGALIGGASRCFWVSNNDGATRALEIRLTRGALVATAQFPASLANNGVRAGIIGGPPSMIAGDVLEARVTALTTPNAVRFGCSGRLWPIAA